jgi:hypothetical protein
MISLTPEDWAEIYYALDTKSVALRRGDYVPEDALGDDARWIAHLEAIKDKIGPDGADAASEGVARST